MPDIPPTSQETTGAPRALTAVLALVLAVVTVGVFTPGMDGGFVYDDLLLVERAPATQSLGAAIEHWMEPYYAFAAPNEEVQRGLWRPLTSLAIAAGRTVAGGDPFGFHAVSLLVHVLAVWTAFRLAALLLRRRGMAPNRSEWAAAVIALVFAIHPAQVEAVSWISAINDPAWGLFGLLALLLYERAGARERTSFVAPLLAFAALLCKEQAIVILPIAVLLDFAGDRKPRLLQVALMTLPLAAWYALRVRVFGDADAGLLRPAGDFGFDGSRETTFRIELAGGFLQNAYWPSDPAVFRPVHPVLPTGSTAFVGGIAWLASVLGATVVAWLWDRRTAAFGALMLLVVVAPIVIAPDRAGMFPLSDRYLYVGIFGASLSVFAIIAQLPTFLPLLLAGLAAPAAMVPITWRHQARFENDIVFRTTAAEEDAPKSPNVLWGAGRAYLDRYARSEDLDDLQTSYLYYLHSLRAVSIYGDGSFVDDTSLPLAERTRRLEELILDTPPDERRLDPTVFATLDDRLQATLGQIACNLFLDALTEGGDLDYPLQLVEGAKQIWEEDPQLDALRAEIHRRRGELDEARAAISQAIVKAPGSSPYHVALGGILALEGDVDAARRTLARAVELDPTNDATRLELATIALRGGNHDVAERELDVVLESTDMQSVLALSLRAGLELERGRPTEAFRWIDRALAIDPNNGEVHKQRGIAASRVGDVDGAIEGFARACELLPDDYDSHRGFAALMLLQQPPVDAAEATRRAWAQTTRDALVRAYMLSPRTGEEQLLLQDQIVPFLDEDPDVAFNLATELLRQGRDVLSLFWLQRVVDWRGNWPPGDRSEKLVKAFTTSGRLYLRAGDRDAALEAFRDAVLTEPDDFFARFELGDLLFSNGDFQAAKPHLARALELFDPEEIAPEFRSATRGTIENRLRAIEEENSSGPPPPPEGGSGADR
ncbi:MAG: tetratricopeptide repeat protein [Planctomycetota bacterium]